MQLPAVPLTQQHADSDSNSISLLSLTLSISNASNANNTSSALSISNACSDNMLYVQQSLSVCLYSALTAIAVLLA